MGILLMHQRERIRDLLVGRVIDPIKAALDKREQDIGDLLYDHLYSIEEQRMMDALPEGWLPHITQIGVYADLNRINGGGAYHSYDLSRPRRHPATGKSVFTHDQIGAVLSDVVVAYRNDVTAHDKLKRDLRGEVLATMAAFSTHSQLRKGWPEARSIVDRVLGLPADRPDLNLPAINALNSRLDLPPETS